jgi:hypothetical protein
MRFELLIGLGNDAMQDGRDVADALRKVAAQIEDYHFPGPSVPRPIKDINGSQVGTWAIEEE